MASNVVSASSPGEYDNASVQRAADSSKRPARYAAAAASSWGWFIGIVK